MRASVGPDPTVPDPTVVVATRRRLPRPVVWLLWLLGALLGSVALGFLAGLARPREPDAWSSGPDEPPADPSLAASSESTPAGSEGD